MGERKGRSLVSDEIGGEGSRRGEGGAKREVGVSATAEEEEIQIRPDRFGFGERNRVGTGG